MQHWSHPAFAGPPLPDRWRASSGPADRTWLAASIAAFSAHAALVLFLAISSHLTPSPKVQEPASFPLLLDQITSLSTSVIPGQTIVAAHLHPPKRFELDTDIRSAAKRPANSVQSKPRPTTEINPPTYSGTARSSGKSAAPSQWPSGTAGPAAPVPSGGSNDAALLAGLERQIDDAVRAAAVMPEAARRQRRQGRTCLRFSYKDGTVDQVALVTSSQSRLLDEAALAALRRANYPAPPARFWGRRLNLQVWVDFTLAG